MPAHTSAPASPPSATCRGMRPIEGFSRTLLLLLVLRMVAAPVALRPGSPSPRTGTTFVARVCAWPAARPQRLRSILSLVPLSRGKGPVPARARDLGGLVPPPLCLQSPRPIEALDRDPGGAPRLFPDTSEGR